MNRVSGYDCIQGSTMVSITFKGKQFVQNHHLAVKYHELVPDEKKSLTNKVSLHDNLIIHGDNLAALKALLPTYAGKVKCIFIDPPYNTGNEKWVYNDNVNSPMMQEWLGKVVDKDDLTRHDKWLCMMWPRLRLLRELLTENGSIWVTIDDTEHHRLRLLMDEIFGEENFVANVVWHARDSVQNDTDISTNNVNHIICYAKKRRKEGRRLKESNKSGWFDLPSFVFYPLKTDAERYSNPDNDPRGPWKADPFDAPGVRDNLNYKITNPNTKEDYLPAKGRHWRTEENNYKDLLKDNRILFGKKGTSGPQLKVFLNEKTEFGEIETNWWDGPATTTDGIKFLDIILPNHGFDNPKPYQVVKKILEHTTLKDDIILDSFAGSGTTGQAVIALNKEDEGNRRFILIEMEDYANTITAERVRRVIKGVSKAKDKALQKGLGGTFSYFELGKPIEMANILSGKDLPSYLDLARYIFFTATGEKLDERQIKEDKFFVGESQNYQVFMFYQPDAKFLRSTALTLERVEQLGAYKDKRRLVFAPTKYLDQEFLDKYRIDFAQLPFEIYRLAK